MENPRTSLETKPRHREFLSIAYVIVVLLLDIIPRHISLDSAQWLKTLFIWQSPNGLDFFKLLLWFILPFLVCVWTLDKGQFTLKRWKKRDYALLAGIMIIGISAVIVIPHIPSLRSMYRGIGHAPSAAKWAFAKRMMLWNLSWLPGWEFLHRYILLRAVDRKWTRYGWLLVPLSEGLYHLEKPWPETIGMIAFSLAATYWARKRRNVLLPFLAHLTIEAALIVFLLVT